MERQDVQTDREIVRRVLDVGVQCILEAYEDAGMRGLCGTGRFEVAVDALRHLDPIAVLQEIDSHGVESP